MVSASLVIKAHGVCAIIFGLIFLIATFGWSFWLIGPEQLIAGWDKEDDTLNFVTRFLGGVLLGLGYFEYVLADHEKSKDIYVRYHVVLAILMLWSTVAVQVYWLSWLYAALITLFLIGGIIGTTEGYSAVES